MICVLVACSACGKLVEPVGLSLDSIGGDAGAGGGGTFGLNGAATGSVGSPAGIGTSATGRAKVCKSISWGSASPGLLAIRLVSVGLAMT